MSAVCQCQETGQPCARGATGDHICPTASRVKSWLAGTNPSTEACPRCSQAVTVTSRGAGFYRWSCRCGTSGATVAARTGPAVGPPAHTAAPSPTPWPTAAPAAPTPSRRTDGPAFVGEYAVRGAKELRFDLAPGAMAHCLDAGVAACEHALARAWEVLPEWRRGALRRQFAAAGGLAITLDRNLSIGGKQADAMAVVRGASMKLDVGLAERAHPDEIRRIVLHEFAHLAGWRDEGGADAQALVWLEGRDR